MLHQRKLWFAILPLLITVVTLIALTGLSMYVLSAVRAYVGGEGLWSKSQKDAVFHLVRYASTADEDDFGKYEQAIAIPLGGRKAREALDRPAGAIDYAAARQGILQGRNHPDDVESLSFVFVRLRHLSYMERAIEIWEEGDRLIAEVVRAAGELRTEVRGGRDPARIELITARLRRLNEELLPLEDAFSYTLGEASRWARDLLFTIAALLGALLFGTTGAIYVRGIYRSAAAETALRKSRDVLSLAMQAGRMGAWSRETGAGTVWWSPELEDIFGLPRGAFKGTESAFFELVHEADRGAVALAVETALASRRDYVVEFRFRHASGEWRWMEGRGQALYGNDGRPVTLYGIGVDITERKLAAEERKRTEENLRRLAADLANANTRKDEFLAVLAHELRNPLAPIRNAVGIMRLHRPLPQGLNEVFEIIDRQARHLTRLVDDLLEVSRITQGKLQLRKERIALGQSVADAVEAITPIAEAAGQELAVELPAEPLYVDGDATRITQIVVNLLSNAVKFTPSGGHIRLSAAKLGTEAVLRVRDDGIGIRAEALPRLYEMFSQLSPILERKHGGLGIGLALVRGLVELHGGTVEASSGGMGKGSEFIVRLPLAPALEQAAPEAEPPGLWSGAHPRKRVLVVDDSEDTARSLRHLIELMGHDVLEAHDGAEAVRAACAHEPDLVLLDIGLPGMNGYEAAREIRRRASAAIKLVAVTGWGQHEDKRRSLEAGFDLHVTKPVEMVVLRSLLESPDAVDRVSSRIAYPA